MFILLILQAPNLLSPEEESRVNEVLMGFAETVRKRRLMAYPYFKDFDRVCILFYPLIFPETKWQASIEVGGGGMKFGQILCLEYGIPNSYCSQVNDSHLSFKYS